MVLGHDRRQGMRSVLTSSMMIVMTALGADAGPTSRRVDRHSRARPDEVRVDHVALDLTVDFEAHELRGTAILSVERVVGAPVDAPLVVDTKGLVIEAVESVPGPGGGPLALKHSSGAPDPVLGSALSIELPAGVSRVRVRYRTTSASTALQWLGPRGTAGRKHPFLFTQSQAVHARTWIPLQDSPAVRVTYEARVAVPAGLTALMSAEGLKPPGTEARPVFEFRMDRPVPPYLIALAVGDLAFRRLGERTGVWADPAVLDRAANEFAETEAMVRSAEARYGPYRWGRYDLLVLPPSFPFGGMENPRLTFATPTVIAGDRSLVSLIAHELAHSWSGNLVTNATWSDFWLNEGFTTYIERRIVEDLYGRQRAEMERLLGLTELREELERLPPPDQVLHVVLDGRDPDDGMTDVPYEKGALFLSTLEREFGRAALDDYLRGYFDRFAFRSITTADLVADLKEHLLSRDEQAARRVDLDAWLERPGLPAGHPEPDASAFARVDAAARDWRSRRVEARQLGAAGWSTQEWLRFLQAGPDDPGGRRMAELDDVYHLTEQGNAEIACQWLLLAVRNGYAPADSRLESFLTTIGRRKFVVPLYAGLTKTPAGRARALAIFERARPFYHPITSASVEKLLAGPPTQGD